MKTDEVIKALKNCAYNNSCEGCMFVSVVDDDDCKNNMLISAADLLEQLTEENEQLKEENRMLKSGTEQIMQDYKLCIVERDELQELQYSASGLCGRILNRATELVSETSNLRNKICLLRAENEQLKKNQPVTCGECIHRITAKDMEMHGCNLFRLAPIKLDDYCSYGERRVEE